MRRAFSPSLFVPKMRSRMQLNAPSLDRNASAIIDVIGMTIRVLMPNLNRVWVASSKRFLELPLSIAPSAVKLLGHSSIIMSQKYAHLADETLFSAVDAAASAMGTSWTDPEQVVA